MLVLSRLKDQAVVIGDGPNKIKVIVVEVRGDKVRLGFEAPLEMPVHREEVYDAIKREGGKAERWLHSLRSEQVPDRVLL